jgi:SH3-like domain-containing protein
MHHKITIAPALAAASLLAVFLNGCVEQSAVQPDLGPMSYDASGTMPCSAGAPTFDEACGWRVVRKPNGAEIWISNIAVSDRPAYRVLTFSNGEFTARDGAPLQVSKDADTWTIRANGNEHYRFADALISGG